MRNMSFAMTIPQVRAHTKTVTRRLGWWFLRPGDQVRAVEKAMGLRKGEKIKAHKIHPGTTINRIEFEYLNQHNGSL